MFFRWQLSSCLIPLLLISSETLSSQVMKRSDDQNPLEAVVSKLSQDIAELKARMQAVENSAAKKAAFRAELPGVVHLTANAPIHFQLVHDVGGGYDSATGIYTAPLSGWYSFEYQLYPQHTGSFNFDLLKNNVLVTRTGCSSIACPAGTTVHASAGDRFWLQTAHDTTYYQGYHSYFSAALIVVDN